jgi:hypothetical protein
MSCTASPAILCGLHSQTTVIITAARNSTEARKPKLSISYAKPRFFETGAAAAACRSHRSGSSSLVSSSRCHLDKSHSLPRDSVPALYSQPTILPPTPYTSSPPPLCPYTATHRQLLCDHHQAPDIPRCIRRIDSSSINRTLHITTTPEQTWSPSRCVAAPQICVSDMFSECESNIQAAVICSGNPTPMAPITRMIMGW